MLGRRAIGRGRCRIHPRVPTASACCRDPTASHPTASTPWSATSWSPASRPRSAKRRSGRSIERWRRRCVPPAGSHAAWHFREAGDADSAAEMVDASVSSVLAAGHLEQARQFLDGSAGSIHRADALILRSRLELERGNLRERSTWPNRHRAGPQYGTQAGLALLSLTRDPCATWVRRPVGRVGVASTWRPPFAGRAPSGGSHSCRVEYADRRRHGRCCGLCSVSSPVVQDAAGHIRYAGITRLNLAGILLWQGRPREAARVAARAEVDLGSSSSSPSGWRRRRSVHVRSSNSATSMSSSGSAHWSSRPPTRQHATKQQLRRHDSSATTDRWRWPSRLRRGSGIPPWRPATVVPGLWQRRPWQSGAVTQSPPPSGSRWPTTRCMMLRVSSAWA